jgi:signal transduction histidine kinase
MSSAAKKLKPEELALHKLGWNYRILAVDDEVEIAEVYKRILAHNPLGQAEGLKSSRTNVRVLRPETIISDFKFEVDLANSFEEALDKFTMARKTGHPYAMGFFDVRLGGEKDGVQLVKEIFNKDPDFMAVFVTAHNDRSLESFQETLGPEQVDRWDYVNKPFIPNEIIQQARARVTLWNLRKERETHAGQLEELNRRVQESEKLTSVAAVARGVAHEFGNLLMQIVGKAEITRDKSKEEMQKALDQIINASQRASEILDRFHHLSDHKASQIGKVEEDLLGIVRGAHDLLSHQFRRHNIEFTFEREESVSALVHGTSLLQVLVNLFINAVHAMEESGGKIIVSLHKDGGTAFLSVRDTGPGVSKEHITKITEPFYTTKGDKGTGLGLSICKEIIEIDHRGEFIVGNHESGGFQIQIRIPLKAEAT